MLKTIDKTERERERDSMFSRVYPVYVTLVGFKILEQLSLQVSFYNTILM